MTEKPQKTDYNFMTHIGACVIRGIAESIEEQEDARNFMAFDISTFGNVKYEVTFRRAEGMTPWEYINVLRKRIIDLEFELAQNDDAQKEGVVRK